MLEFLESMSRTAGAMAMDYRYRLSELSVEHKSIRDVVSEADIAIEKYLCSRILGQFPSHAIYGEESGVTGSGQDRWIIDPIDGTSSFLHGQPFFSISIAYEKNGVVQAGAVYAPVLGELFMAERGKGATCNGSPIGVSRQKKLDQSILATGFACLRAEAKHNNLPYLQAILPKLRDMRRFGSAALDLAFVASGRLEGFWELYLNLYDIAAGLLLVEEAGGMSSDFSGAPIKTCKEVISTNGFIHPQMIELLTSVKQSVGIPLDE
jgi:myo-inositol-1(or 4)-monophosphatase